MFENSEAIAVPEIPKEMFYVYVELETRDFEYEVYASSEDEARELVEQLMADRALSLSNLEVNEQAYSSKNVDGELGDKTKEEQGKYYVFGELETKGLEFEVSASSEEKAEELAINETYKRGLQVALVEVNKQPLSPDYLDGKLEE
jgi:hypothetical protein